MGKIKDAIKDSLGRKAPKDEKPVEDPAATAYAADMAAQREAAKQRFLEISAKFVNGGCTRGELDAAREEAGG